jgi:methyl-accepting chemotaxis protein
MPKLKIATQLTTLTGIFVFFFVLSSGIGLYALKSSVDNTNFIYEINVVPVNAMQAVSDTYAVAVPDLVHRTMAGAISWPDAAEALQALRAEASKQAEIFDEPRFFTALPEALPDFIVARERADADLDRVTALIAHRDSAGLSELEATSLRHSLPEVWRALDKIGDAKADNLGLLRDDEFASYQRTRMLLLGIGALALLVSLATSIAITRRLSRDLGAEPGTLRGIAEAVGRGELYGDIATRAGDNNSVNYSLAAMRDMLRDLSARVRENADNVSSASAEIADGNLELSARTEQQAAALEQTAASMEQLGGTVQQNAEHATQASELAQTATETAERGGQQVDELVRTMQDINQGATRITGISSMIESIAFQTNILALNAAVEAARVGEFGRGFAVVAGEVRSLAQRAAQSAKEINDVVASSVQRIQDGGALADQAGAAIQKIVADNRRLSQLVHDISIANREQSEGVRQVGDAVVQMDQTTQENAAQVELSAAAADNLRMQARQLVDLVAVFKLRQGTEEPASAPVEPRLLLPGGQG